jgi:hypothetical protein
VKNLDPLRPKGKSVVPIIIVDNTRERQAWEAYQALRMTEQRKPSLRDNPYWTAHCNAMWQDWFSLFEVL